MERMECIEDMSLAGQQAAYDAAAKRLLSSKKILAWILKYCVEEFRDSEIADIRDRYIFGKPEVASVPIEPDKTNAVSYIQGERTEDKSLTEGMVTFDIRFRAITPDNDPIELIINVEAQQNIHTTYPLVKRALYYCSRLVSSQYQVEFVKSHYEGIKKVYSIWLCMDAPGIESSITQYRIQEDCLWKEQKEDKANYDLIRAVMVYISQNQKDFGNRLMSLLYILFKKSAHAAEKKKVLRESYDVDLDADEMKEVDDMCNLSTGVFSRGLEEGRAKGRAEGREEEKKKFVINMLQNHVDIEVIAKVAESPVEYVRQVAEEAHVSC